MAERYNPQDIEPKWREQWAADDLYRTVVDYSRPKHYALTMLPYPSGDLHIGHWYVMAPSDARARWMRMRGYNVLFPMGFDAFGLPAENAAIKRRVHPMKWTYANIDRMREQMRTMGTIFDWEREMVSCDTEYYKWSQWFFTQFFKHDLAYRQLASVDFCPNCNTTLAREQVWGDDRHCERCGTPVIKKDLEQWFFRTTRYAEELLQGLEKINWPEKVKLMQTNWIGKSQGAHVTFHTEQGQPLEVFTTRPDTLWGVTFMVLAPEHPLVTSVTTADQQAKVDAYINEAKRRTEIERAATDKEKTGVFTGGYAINPVNQERVPIWIGDYVMMGYGTGAIMGVPAHDQRDFAFARKFGIPVRVVIQPADQTLDGDTMTAAYPEEGVMANSRIFDGTPTADYQAVAKVIAWLEQQTIGKGAVSYRLRDWLISRQRYWGTPIPMIHCPKCGTVPVPDEQLPVILPEDVEFVPTGESPLKLHPTFRFTTCPQCGGPAERDTDTMDTFMCSSWYQLRYLSPHYEAAPFDPQEGAYWLPVDQYTGGIEHATMHLIYTRFFSKALRDCGVFADTERIRTEHDLADAPSVADEPMLALYNQGMVLGEPRDGSRVTVVGTREVEKVNARRIQVITDAQQHTVAAEAGEVTIEGEIVKRAETLLNIEQANDSQVTVEVFDNTQINDALGNAITLNDLRYRLSVEKMSKSKGNVIAPDELVARYGADVTRGYLMSAYRWELGGPWDSQGIQGTVRWLNEVWSLIIDTPRVEGEADPSKVRALGRKTHITIKNVGERMASFSFNTAVSALIELKNLMMELRRTPIVSDPVWQEAVETMLLLMAPITPYIAEELWQRIGKPYSIHQQAWPSFNPEVIKADEITLVVQINGKVRDRLIVPADITEDDAKARVLVSPGVTRYTNGQPPKQIIFIQNRGIMSIVL